MSKNNSYSESTSFAKLFEKESTIEFVKSNERMWTDTEIELSTSLMPPFLSFAIKTNKNREVGIITSIYHWSEDYNPTPVVYPDLENWNNKTLVNISFQEKDDEDGGKDGIMSL